MKSDKIICDHCGMELEYPCISIGDWKVKFRIGTNEKPLTFDTIRNNCDLDFCGTDCMKAFIEGKREVYRSGKGDTIDVFSQKGI